MRFLFVTLIAVACSASAQEHSFTNTEICRAAIATIMHKDVDIVSASGSDPIEVSYSSDGIKKYKCKIDGTRVMWGNADGRWRNHLMDEKIFWLVRGNQLVIRQDWGDGSTSEIGYAESDL